MAKSNIVLIGMAGAGKSTIGRILASQLSFAFIDSDQLIEQRENKSLQTLLDSEGYLGLRKIEEEAILTFSFENESEKIDFGNILFGTEESGVSIFNGKEFLNITENEGLISNNIILNLNKTKKNW